MMNAIIGFFSLLCLTLVGHIVWLENVLGARPNILFLVVDDMRPELGCYGEPVQTPNIDQLAAHSVQFTNAHAQQAFCAPSRSSFLTSRRPDSTRVYDLHTYWREAGGNFTTLPQYFKENGYFTASVGKVFHPNKASNFTDDYPYSWTTIPYHPSTQKYKRDKVCLNPDGTRHENLLCPVDVSKQPEGTLPDIQSAEYAISLLKNISEGNWQSPDGPGQDSSTPHSPFFLAVGLHKPHIPLKFPEEFLDLYPLGTVRIAGNRDLPVSLPKVAFETYSDIREREDIAALNLSFPYGPVPDKYHRLIRQHYYAASSYMDSRVGRVLHALEEFGYANNTIIVLVGDHGWQLGENSEFAKYSNYITATRVPLLIHIPASLQQIGQLQHVTRGEKFQFQDVFNQPSMTKKHQRGKLSSSSPVELVDLFPTLCELAGLKPIPDCPVDSHSTQLCTEGADLSPLIESIFTGSEVKTWKNCSFSQFPRPSDMPQNNTDKPNRMDIRIMGYSIRTDEYRYAEWVGFDPSAPSGADWSDVHARELYNLMNDPEETENMAGYPIYKDVVEKLAAELRRGWKACVPSKQRE